MAKYPQKPIMLHCGYPLQMSGGAYCQGPWLAALPSSWSGTCALIQLATPFTLANRQTDQEEERESRGLLGSPYLHRSHWALFLNLVPNEFKARNQMAAGFESVLCWRSTVNKNVVGLITCTITSKGLLTILKMPFKV
ncbi:hypothetical protein QTO34_010727 [Cnephaeus nilssonii]|uniref:Uncharacterized protein n=1 Tax=Cnephaeus nilssonii TaxID=3371016 RepID=A0AA40HGR9_CNENI|nr:hypothetical protein QTO34_010727 [Eptesicus nilssonii]